jgi:Zn-dependent metalloprotease/subtilisin family serine protease
MAVLALAAASVCVAETALGSGPTADQQAAARDAGVAGLRVQWRPEAGTPMSVRGENLGRRGAFSGGKGLRVQGAGAFARDAVAVLDNVARLYRIRDAAQEFAAQRTDADTQGFRHTRLRQRYQGLPVVGGDLIVHFNRHGEAYEVSGRYVPDLEIPTHPALTGAEAVKGAAADLAALQKPAGILTDGPTLCVFALGAAPALAYQLVLSFPADAQAEPGRWRYWIDAATGAVLLRYNDVPNVPAPTDSGTTATITGRLLAGEGGGIATVTGWYENTGLYYLYNNNLYWEVHNDAASGYPDAGTYAHRATNDWAETDRVEMSLARNFTLTQQYFRDVHGRHSFDDRGIPALAYAHVGINYANAYWDGTAFYFGDGDGVTATSLAVLDISSHEFTHAVTENTANLIYSGESGALNESFSDIFGACVEFATQPDGRSLYPGKAAGTADWLVAEDCWVSATAMRDMRSPGNATTVGTNGRQPSRYKGTFWYSGSDDNGGVHRNSGVQNFVFYLLSEGGSGNNDGINYNLTGIGLTNAAQVAYRALTVYCGPNTDYPSVRQAWFSAAEDLNPSWVPIVREAWASVGVSSSAISPTNSLVFRGPLGGPFGQVSPALTLRNNSDTALSWSTTHSQPWLTSGAGVVPANGSTVLTVSITSDAAGLPRGVYTDTLVISNLTEGISESRPVVLQVGQRDYFTEGFPADWLQDPQNLHLNDLAYSTLTFSSDNSVGYDQSFYRASRDPATRFLSTTNGTALSSLTFVNPYVRVDLADGAKVWLYGIAYTSFYVGAHGYITFGSGDTERNESFDHHFSLPRISAMFRVMDTVGGTRTWTQLVDRAVVTFQDVSQNSFQYELFFDGTIRITYLESASRNGLAGLSRGQGVPAGFVESNLSAYGPFQGPPDAPDAIMIQPLGGLPARGYAGGPFAPDRIVYTLSNTGAVPVAWTATQTQSWVQLSAAGGTLDAGGATNVTVQLAGAAASLGAGSYAGAVTFSNTLSGTARTRPVTLEVLPPAGQIAILDSLAPVADKNMPFGPVTMGLSRTEPLTITNTDAVHPIVVTDIALGWGPYREDFNDGVAQGWVANPGANWEIVAGEYRATAQYNNEFMISAYGRQIWSNVTMQAQWAWASGTGILFLRASPDFGDDVGSAYGFQVEVKADTRISVFKQVNGVRSWLQEATTQFTGILVGPNLLRASAQGSNLAFYANGTLLWKGADTALTEGRIGLGATGPSQSMQRYDNVQVSELPPAGFGSVAPATSPFILSGLPALPLTLAAQASVSFNVAYVPGLEGHDEGTLSIRSDAVGAPEVAVALSGDGTADNLGVQPETPLQLSGHPGGPFAASGGFVLSNAGPSTVMWAVSAAEDWLVLAPSSGSLAPGATAPVAVSAGTAANGLGEGVYLSGVTFSNLTSAATASRTVRLEVFTSPSITIAPPALTVTNVAGGATQRALAIGNAAGADGVLSFQLLPREISRTTAGAPAAPPAGHDFTRLASGVAYKPGRLLVRFAATQTAAAQANLLAGMRATLDRQYTQVPGLCRINVDLGTAPEQTLTAWNRLPGVLYAEPDYEVQASVVPNDERFGLMWGLQNTGQTGGTPGADIHAPAAWELQTGSRNVTVAVIDTGIDYRHEDLAANMWRNPGEIAGNGVDDDGNGYVDDVYGINAITRTGDPMDDNDHGTHCAGAIGAAGNNSVGVVGVCWNARLMALKFLDANMRGWSSDAIVCIEYAVQKGAKVLNFSAYTRAYQQAMKDAVDAAGAAGVIVCAAAGNSGDDEDGWGSPCYPAAFDSPNIIAVTATDKNDKLPWYSDYGQQSVDLAAPGDFMLNCKRGSLYTYMSGTSMATPLVAGACALLWSQNSLLSVAAVKDALLNTVDVPAEPLVCVSGGRLNVARALAQAGSFWLTAAPVAATNLPPAAVTNVTVGFNAGFLPAGTYTGELAVVCNDRAASQTNVPCIMVVALDNLGLSPAAGLSAGGPRGGPFTPDRRVYAITNLGAIAVHWTVTCTQSWAVVEPAGGTLAPGEAGTVTARLTQVANTLPAGVRQQTAIFANQDSGAVFARDISLTVAATSNTDALVISPFVGLTAEGNVGGPFTPSNASYRLVNACPSNLAWTARASTNWLSLSATNGTLDAGATTNLTVWLNALANTLNGGVYTARVDFCNTTSGVTQSRALALTAKAYPRTPFAPNIPAGTMGVSLTTNLTWNDTGATSLVGQATASALDVLICHTYQPAVDDIRNKLLAAVQFHSVTNLNPKTTTPTLAQLQAFDAVLVCPDKEYSDTNAWGNVMADYVDAGGGVVCMLQESAGSPWLPPMGGRWLSQGYRTIPQGEYTWGPPARSLGTVFQPHHPIMWGVTAFDGGEHSWRPATTTVLPGSARVADWSDGKPLVVTRSVGGRPRADLAFFPTFSSSADGGRLMANALQYVAEATYGYGCTFDIYFGTSWPPTNCVVSGTKRTRFNPGPLTPATTYYWQVIAHNDAGVTAGPVWSFTTTAGTPHEWLTRYGLTNQASGVEEMLDRDGDGLAAWQEYVAGTDPTNPISCFRVLDISFSNELPVVRFFGTTNSGLASPFGMQRLTNLLEAGVLVDGAIPRSPTGTNLWIDAAPLCNGPVFYRPKATYSPPGP